ncbi:hypothetical protein [Streptomyces mirabilis]|uniref:hypothetical protein n=1 Tax=Streptomyces mirabilis TaxID=68239 RepID=UPI003248E72C
MSRKIRPTQYATAETGTTHDLTRRAANGVDAAVRSATLMAARASAALSAL